MRALCFSTSIFIKCQNLELKCKKSFSQNSVLQNNLKNINKYNNFFYSLKFQIRNIDKSMIGLPTNFQHCAHIGCSDVSITTNSLPLSNGLLHRTNVIYEFIKVLSWC